MMMVNGADDDDDRDRALSVCQSPQAPNSSACRLPRCSDRQLSLPQPAVGHRSHIPVVIEKKKSRNANKSGVYIGKKKGAPCHHTKLPTTIRYMPEERSSVALNHLPTTSWYSFCCFGEGRGSPLALDTKCRAATLVVSTKMTPVPSSSHTPSSSTSTTTPCSSHTICHPELSLSM